MPKEISRIHFSSIDSTNSWAKANIHLLDLNKITLVSADEQTAGRGRMKRQWLSTPKQNITASFCFFLPEETKNLFNLAQVMSLSISKTLERFGFQCKLKWPNDILISDKKIAGILTEIVTWEENICAIIGVGININMSVEAINSIDQPATSLFAEKGKKLDLEEVTKSLSIQFARDLEIFLEDGFAPFLVDYSACLVHISKQPLRFHENNVLLEGTFHSLNEDGSLNMLLPSGKIKRFYSGELR